jgi:hypothetical protein
MVPLAIEIQDIWKSYGEVTAVRGLSLQVPVVCKYSNSLKSLMEGGRARFRDWDSHEREQFILQNCYYGRGAADSVHISVIQKCNSAKIAPEITELGIRHPLGIVHPEELPCLFTLSLSKRRQDEVGVFLTASAGLGRLTAPQTAIQAILCNARPSTRVDSAGEVIARHERDIRTDECRSVHSTTDVNS